MLIGQFKRDAAGVNINRELPVDDYRGYRNTYCSMECVIQDIPLLKSKLAAPIIILTPYTNTWFIINVNGSSTLFLSSPLNYIIFTQYINLMVGQANELEFDSLLTRQGALYETVRITNTTCSNRYLTSNVNNNSNWPYGTFFSE